MEKSLNLMYLLRKDNLTYDIEPEVLKYSYRVSKFWLNRYKQRHPNQHWTRNQQETMFIGLIGQTAFQIILDQKEIFHISNNPLIEWHLNKPYDFLTEKASIEVKTVADNAKLCLIKVKEWHGNDILVCMQLSDPEVEHVCRIRGWLTNEQIENLPIAKKGEKKFSKYAECYYCNLTELNTDINALFKKLSE